MFVHGVRGPGVHELVQELAQHPPDLLALAGGELPHQDGDDLVVVGVLDDEADAHRA